MSDILILSGNPIRLLLRRPKFNSLYELKISGQSWQGRLPPGADLGFKQPRKVSAIMETIPDITEALVGVGVIQDPAPVLEKVADQISDFENEAPIIEKKLRSAIAEISCLYDFRNGIGIAAPQLGISKRAILFGCNSENLKFLANPEIVPVSEQLDYKFEGCMSFWAFRGLVPRFSEIKMIGYDVSGHKKEMILSGTLARMAQHECDHLDGILYTQRMDKNEKLVTISEYAKIKSRLL